ncbi:phenylacetate--CoA ligase family protein [Fodinicola acaciae]|uniref:phenylacetate--CoA ligase family protein n=1 Tax=Fodinicola acaciae TaxID=2681555 RepID=UPI0013D33D1A|nr:phenylacetate--CoA ligase family protein [Fodinicola acaciae]
MSDLARDARRALREGPDGIARRQRTRLAEIVAYARQNSPFYRDLYRGLPENVEDVTLLPVVDKKILMAHFDDWSTDREVTRERVEAFIADPELVGQRFLGKYLVASTSGTTGVRGLFLSDGEYARVHLALGSRATNDLGLGGALRVLTHAGRTAVIAATGGHYYSAASVARFRLDHPRLGRIMKVFSIDQPLPELVAGLNDYDPASVAGFLTLLTTLAGEQEAGRLRIRPAVLMPGGETVTTEARQRLATTFGATVRPAYMATECSLLALSCPHGWYHVNADWVVVEPVDADHRPVPPGEPSHTVLISNLANRAQPILRYDLGDSMVVRPDRCECGSPLPAVQVQGRAADLVTLPAAGGGSIGLSPMLFGVLLDGVAGVERYQLVQTAPDRLRVRLRPVAGADSDQVWRAVCQKLARLLAEQRVAGVALEHGDEEPEQASSGKVRRIIPLAKA